MFIKPQIPLIGRPVTLLRRTFRGVEEEVDFVVALFVGSVENIKFDDPYRNVDLR